MAFSFNEDCMNPPATARILNFMCCISIIGCAFGVALAFFGYPWVNDIYPMAGPRTAIVLGILFIGQAGTLEALTILNARIRVSFCFEGITGPVALGRSTSSLVFIPPVIPQKSRGRIVKIPLDDCATIWSDAAIAV